MSEPDVLPGAEAWSADGGPHGALVVHGFTGNPTSMRPLAEAFAAAGFAVELPRLPGHGTTVEDMLTTDFGDWSGEAEAAYQRLAGRCERVVVAGLSMGGALTAWLAAGHPEIAGIVLVNPAVGEVADSFIDSMESLAASGTEVMPGIGSDVAKPGVIESAYAGTPVRPLVSLMRAGQELASRYSDIRCPVLLITSHNDHVVPTNSGDYFTERVAGPVERVWLDRSFHVATIDFDQEDIERRAVEFAQKVTASA